MGCAPSTEYNHSHSFPSSPSAQLNNSYPSTAVRRRRLRSAVPLIQDVNNPKQTETSEGNGTLAEDPPPTSLNSTPLPGKIASAAYSFKAFARNPPPSHSSIPQNIIRTHPHSAPITKREFKEPAAESSGNQAGADLAAAAAPLKNISSKPNESFSTSSSNSFHFLKRKESVVSALSLEQSMENRPPSTSSNTSFTRVYRTRSNPRPFSIDTSRARSNQAVLSLCARKIGIKEYPEGREDGRPCDVYWHNVVYSDMKHAVPSPHSRVNKFPGMTELAKKISLTHSITSMQKLFPDEYNFYPKSWFLPSHLEQFKLFYAQEKEKAPMESDTPAGWFIVKPDDGAQGTGIYLMNDPEQLRSQTTPQLVQEYISDPLLMNDQLKFDFRVYGVIKSLNPLSIYVAREGMVRFCTETYVKPTPGNFENLYSHLTNYSLNKAHDAYIHSNSLHDQVRGSKRLLSTVFHQMEARGIKTKRLWHDIKLIIVKTVEHDFLINKKVLAMLPEVMLHYEHHFYNSLGPQCFQIIGFDIMVRENGEPVLLEVNAAPSLSIDHVPGEYGYSRAAKQRSVVDEVMRE